jgi:hypothetical protein
MYQHLPHLMSNKSKQNAYTSSTEMIPKSDPRGRLDNKIKNHEVVHIPPTKKEGTPTRRCRV